MNTELTISILPQVDACLPILAHELGFAEEEGVRLNLVTDQSWATVLDRLLYGHCDAAQMVAPMAIAATLGRGRPAQPLAVPFVLGLNGHALTVRPKLAQRLRGEATGLGDPVAVGAALRAVVEERKEAGRPLTLGVVHRYASHNYMLRYWLAASGIEPDREVDIVTVTPANAADALKGGDVDGVCVGEPWASIAVERGVGEIVLSTAQIWHHGVEKVLALRAPVLDEKREAIERLIRALRRAGAHLRDPEHRENVARVLAGPAYLEGTPERIARALSDQLLIAKDGPQVDHPDFMVQYRHAANFPRLAQAEWIYSQMVRWDGTPFDAHEARAAAGVCRADVYHSALAGTGLAQAGEPALDVQAGAGTFFDGRTFDPGDIESYLEGFAGTGEAQPS